jgi:UDP-glucuronate decarboxylase
MRVLVTGGAGFLGSHLCERLLAQHHEVLCLDSFVTGSPRNVAHLMGDRNFTLIEQDILEPIGVEIDCLYNLACPASPEQYQKQPIQVLKTSVLGTLAMLTLAEQQKARFVQASTSEIYGDPTEHPQKENYWGHVNCVGPRACYDEGKRAAETACADFRRVYNLDVRIARIFNTYGPRMSPHDGRVVSNFVVQALQGEPITIYGNGMQTRSFCYVDDLIYGLIAMGADDIEGDPINLGNPQELTILQLAKHVLRLTNSKSKIIFKSLPVDDPTRRLPDISRARTSLNWEPRIDLEEGLKPTIAYFAANS